jgi:hypothetical protein
MLKIHSPALKKWKIGSLVKTNTFLFPKDEKIVIDFENMTFGVNVALESKQTGFLDPTIWGTEFKWGNTTIYHPNAWIAMWLD